MGRLSVPEGQRRLPSSLEEAEVLRCLVSPSRWLPKGHLQASFLFLTGDW